MRKTVFGCLGAAAVVMALQFTTANVQAGLFTPCDAAACNPCDAAACDPCGPNGNGCGCEDGCTPRASRLKFGGWLEAGVYGNEFGRRNRYLHANDPGLDALATGLMGNHNVVLPGNTALLHNVALSDPQMNQAWVFVEQTLDTRRGLSFGGRADFMYGTDGRFTQSDGFEYRSKDAISVVRDTIAGDGFSLWKDERWGRGDYFASFAQAYGEAGYGNVSVKFGKFLSPMGSNSIMAPERFFYSMPLAFGVMPVTQTGIIGTWAPGKNFSAFGGWVKGEDILQRSMSLGDGILDGDNGAALFGVKFSPNKRVNFAYTAMIGHEDIPLIDDILNIVAPGVVPWSFNINRDYFVQSFVVNVKPNKRWDYTFDWTLRNNMLGGIDIDPAIFGVNYIPAKVNTGAYGINQELVYRANSRWAFGGRFEWLHNYGSLGFGPFNGWGVTVPQVGLGVYNSDTYSFVLGANWTPSKWLLVRPEIRYDDVKIGGVAGDLLKNNNISNKYDQISGGVSAVVKF